MRPAAVALLVAIVVFCGCGVRRFELSPYGSRYAVGRNDDGSARPRSRPHEGVDLGRLSIGDVVIASAPGIVSRVHDSRRAGRTVEITHLGPETFRVVYVHLDEVLVEPGQLVPRGEPIGTVGLFRYSGEVVHVHLELRCGRASRDRCAVSGPLRGTTDPMRYMEGCFDRERDYPRDRLVLTYPFSC